MAKVKYYYDSATLSYRKIIVKKSVYFKNTLFVFLAFLLSGFIGFIVLSQFILSPKQRAQKRELENLKLHYNILSKRMDETAAVLKDLQERDNNIYRIYFEADPIPEEQRKAGFGGVNRYKTLEGYDNSELIINLTKQMDILSKQLVIQSKSLDEIVEISKEKEKMLASIPAILPVKKEDMTSVASGYKMRMHPILKINKFHKGMDFTAPKGTPVYATGNGRVTYAERNSTFGNVVMIEHGYGYKTIYAHLSSIKTRVGARVNRGDLIGLVGNTGLSVASHLHYEVHKNDAAVNPINFYYGNLTPAEFAAIKMTAEDSQSLD